MGKDSDTKEDSGFGFKDRAKAEETLELLKTHDISYQRLTVRGLLGRAKRVLTLTKAEEKIQNIKGAMEVFEKWLVDYEKEHPAKNKPSKPEKKSGADDGEDAEASDKVQGLGFKDKLKAEETLKVLEGRDPDYQKLAIKGLLGSAKRVLSSTKDKEKLQNIKDAMAVFEDFLDDFDKNNRSKANMNYLPLNIVDSCLALAKKQGVAGKCYDFIEAYRKVKGDYKKLRTVEDTGAKKSWDIVRNKELGDIKLKVGDAKLFEDDGNPTKDHLRMIVWAYSPEDYKMKKLKIKLQDEDVEMEDADDSKEVKRTSKRSEDSSDKKRKHKDSSSSSNSDGASIEKKRK